MQGVYRQHIFALLLMAVLVIFMSYPVVLHMRDSVAGQGGDPWQTMWRLTSKANGGYREFMRDLVGSGEARLTNLAVWPWVPIHELVGEPLAYNISWIFSGILSGYAMALFVKILTKQKSIYSAAPLLAGIAYMFLPYRSAHVLGHFGAMQLQWIPFICTAVLIYIRRPTLWKIALVGILCSIQAWTEHHYAFWLVMFGVIVGIVYRKDVGYFLPLYKGEKSRTIFWHAILLIAIFIFGVIIPYIPTIKLATTTSSLELGKEQTSRFSADLFSFITPSPQHPIWGNFFTTLFGQYFTGNNAESVQYLGVSVLLIILFFHRHVPVRQKRLWTITIVLFMAISLGPTLHVFGKETAIPLPYALLHNFPIFSAIRVVARAGAMVGFATCVLFGWTIATNIHRTRTSIIAGAIILVEFLFLPFPMQSAKLSSAYDVLATLSGSRIIEIPAATNYTAASRSLYASAVHKKEPIGNIALERGGSADEYILAKSVPAVRQLLYVRTTDLNQDRPEFFNQNLAETLPDAMNYIDAYAVLVHTDSLTSSQQRALFSLLDKIPDVTKQSFPDIGLYIFGEKSRALSDGVFLIRNDGWENVGYDPKKKSVFAEIPHEAHLTIINMNKYPVIVTLEYAVAPQSSGILQAENNFVVKPGEYEVTFKHAGEGKTIIQNPKIRVEQLAL